jgi:FkbM family methyltransferase
MATDLGRDDAAVLEAFHRAATWPSSSRARKLLRAPVRLVAVKVGTVVGSRTGLSVPVRARTFWGAGMRVRIPEAVSNQLVCCGLFEPSMTAFLLRVLGRGDTFVDVGAHYGYFSLLAARLVGAEGQVHAFEPTPSTFAVLAHNLRSLPNALANPTAVWSEQSELTVTDLGTRLAAYNSVFSPRLDGGAAGGRQARRVRVAAVSLDDYCAAGRVRPRFVKIDAESAEHRILQGMDRLLAEDRPFVSLEVGDFDIPGVPASSTVLRAMIARQYAPFEYADGAIRPHAVRTSYGYDNILLAPRDHPLTRRLVEA